MLLHLLLLAALSVACNVPIYRMLRDSGRPEDRPPVVPQIAYETVPDTSFDWAGLVP